MVTMTPLSFLWKSGGKLCEWVKLSRLPIWRFYRLFLLFLAPIFNWDKSPASLLKLLVYLECFEIWPNHLGNWLFVGKLSFWTIRIILFRRGSDSIAFFQPLIEVRLRWHTKKIKKFNANTEITCTRCWTTIHGVPRQDEIYSQPKTKHKNTLYGLLV